MFDRNTLIALIAVGLILFLLPYYYDWIAPPAPPPTEEQAGAVSEQPADSLPTEPVATPFDTALARQLETTTLRPDTGSPLFADTIEYDPRLVEIETPHFRMSIGSDGRITRYTLDEDDYTLKSGGAVKLHRAETAKDPAIGYLDFGFSRDLYTLEGLHFESSTPRLFVPSGSDSVILETGDPMGQYIRLVYVFRAKRYGFDVALYTQGLPEPDVPEFNVTWKGGVPTTTPDPNSDHQFEGCYAMLGEELEEISLGSDEKEEFSGSGATAFVATRSKYFIAALIPQESGAGADLKGSNRAPKDLSSPHIYDARLRQAWPRGASAHGRWQVYWGPIIYDNLSEFDVGLENTMNWGWAIIKPFSRGVLWLLTALGGVIPNYGIVIIIFSILIKVITWPLTRKSQISMKKMSALQPLIKELKEKHAKNPQAANKEMMALYKERGVNPAAGCIPIMLQMPLLYALFIIFRSTIEFRQAPFVGWINDLSQPDVIFDLGFSIPLYGSAVALLPLVMGVSQFFMSKRTMTDPNQKAMIYIMPIFMTLIFNRFPSGLTLYYTLFNTIAILEQRFIKIPDVTQAPPEKKKDSKKDRPSAMKSLAANRESRRKMK